MADNELLLGQILGRLNAIDGRLDRIDGRLDAGDKRFEEQGRRDAADGVVRNMATTVGSWVLTVAGMVGLAVLSHVPFIQEWFIPKH